MKSSIPYGANDMKVSGGRLYFAGGGGGLFTAMYGLKAFTGSGVANDILRFDTSGTLIQDTLEDAPVVEMEISNQYLLTVETTLKSRVIDTPQLNGSLSAMGLKRLAVSSNYVYLAKGRSGVEAASFGSTNIYSLGGAGLPDATAIAVGVTNVFVGAGTNGLYALTKYRPLVRLETELSTNGTPVIKILGAINSSGIIQRSQDLQSYQDWYLLNVTSNPQTVEDTNGTVAFYRFVSP